MEPERITKCAHCGATIDRDENPSTEADKDLVPPIHEAGWWEREAGLHCEECEWVATRAHRMLVSIGDSDER